MKDETSQLVEPKFSIDDVVYYCQERKWLIGRVMRILARSSLNCSTFPQYEIVPEGPNQDACILMSERDVRATSELGSMESKGSL
jgi:hypothetical protein